MSHFDRLRVLDPKGWRRTLLGFRAAPPRSDSEKVETGSKRRSRQPSEELELDDSFGSLSLDGQQVGRKHRRKQQFHEHGKFRINKRLSPPEQLALPEAKRRRKMLQNDERNNDDDNDENSNKNNENTDDDNDESKSAAAEFEAPLSFSDTSMTDHTVASSPLSAHGLRIHNAAAAVPSV
ncbi:MAG: hypothetical protein MHM6MM_006551 [Cercozoa sp. M6MM]